MVFSDSMWIYGRRAVEAVLSNPRRKILRFLLSEGTCLDIPSSIKYEVVGKEAFAELFGRHAVHQGCAVLVNNLPDWDLDSFLRKSDDDRPFVILDQVQDVQNIGSIIRASAVFDIQAIIMTKKNSPSLTAALAKAASGALEFVPIIRVGNLVQAINTLQKQGFWIVGLDERGTQSLHELPLKSGKFACIIGSEGKGMRRLTREHCDFLARIPCNEKFSTLNAAQAATLALYEIFKQRVAL